MARKFWRLRTILIAILIVALTVSIIFAGIPYLPHNTPPHNSITSLRRQAVPARTSTNPGSAYLQLPNISTETFVLGINVTGGAATFCVINDSDWSTHIWDSSVSNSCILQETITVGTLTFTPTSPGTWDVVALNSNPTIVVVEYDPA